MLLAPGPQGLALLGLCSQGLTLQTLYSQALMLPAFTLIPKS